jgi:type I restriction-modification system DNA methylase subunit
MNRLVSNTTRQNWERLNVKDFSDRLTARANKKLSSKNIIPIEYFNNPDNFECVMELLSFVKSGNFQTKDVLYTIALKLLKQSGLINGEKCYRENIAELLQEYSCCREIIELNNFILPCDENDFLGLFYQCLKTEGDRNSDGIYYTNSVIAKKLLRGLDFASNQTYLDPSCGSANLLLNIENVNPKQLFGIDIDPIAVMISKFNLIMKYRNYNFKPQIFQMDFLALDPLFSGRSFFDLNYKFDYIVTNPPWGALSSVNKNDFAPIVSGETFSYFIVQSMRYLKTDATLRYLLPESFMNVKAHSDIRKFILKNYCIEQISAYEDSFTGVTTKFIDITVKNRPPKKTLIIETAYRVSTIPILSFEESKNYVYCMLDKMDLSILDCVYNNDYLTLKDSIWALGIVTGNNKEKLIDTPKKGWEAIFTGKEITRYKLLPNKKYILYDRETLQQVAKDEIYRSPEKLVYKFISNKLIFAYDCGRNLFLNSANILVPKIKTVSIKTVLLFLNSDLFQFIYMKKFGQIKVLQSNLLEMPFISISDVADKKLAELANRILSGEKSALEQAQNTIYDLYGIDIKQRDYIKEFLYGKINNGVRKTN